MVVTGFHWQLSIIFLQLSTINYQLIYWIVELTTTELVYPTIQLSIDLLDAYPTELTTISLPTYDLNVAIVDHESTSLNLIIKPNHW